MAVKVDCSCVGMIDCDMAEEHSEFKTTQGMIHVAADVDVWVETEPLIRANIKSFLYIARR
jgi:hypothetical protein